MSSICASTTLRRVPSGEHEDGSDIHDGDGKGDAVNGGNANEDKLGAGSVKSSASSAPVTPRRRRHSTSEAAMIGYNMDILDPAIGRNSILEAQRDNFGTSYMTTEHPYLNEKALSVMDRVKKKLVGCDFNGSSRVLTVDE
ncbi:unnamed protein product [Phytophthora fragariaefolia]|uniref:Unnamed protein product n=1 Tax=Phytophthora fragariaefolia TaxID=1490495 RepID=A0A9W6Y9T5_9STRA|nr:unnamed protein product [Phytophthora fragariaefolia]